MNEAKAFGKGWAFPPRVGTDGRVSWSSGRDNVRENIRVILLTEAGARLMLPRFGGGLAAFAYEPNTTATRRLIQERVERALAKWEPRIRVEVVSVREAEDDERAAIVDIAYRLVATGAREQVSLGVSLGGR